MGAVYIIIAIIVTIIVILSGGTSGTTTEDTCIDGYIHHITYQTAPFGGKGRQTNDEPTNTPCECTGSSAQSRPGGAGALGRLQSLQEDNCHSADNNGNPQPIPNQAAAASTNGFGSGGPPQTAAGENPGPFPSPPVLMSGASTAARQLAKRAATAGSAFTYTVPFRYLPAGPLPTGATVTAPPTCNASLNPTFFRVAHVDNVVHRYNMCTDQLLATISVPSLPLQVKVTPDGSTAIVTSFSGSITFINTATNTISGSIQVPTDLNFNPSGLAISPDGTYALVTNYPPTFNTAYSYLAVINIASMQITGKIPLLVEGAESVYINPDGTLAWVTHPWDNVVEVLDILTGTLVQELKITEPFSIVFNSTGTRAFISSGAGSVQVIDTSTYATIQSVPADLGATDLQLSPDGLFVFVNNSSAHSVTVIETSSLTASTTNISGTPLGAAIEPTQ
jgi:DNA-binding beta-propeller fold protein YncE